MRIGPRKLVWCSLLLLCLSSAKSDDERLRIGEAQIVGENGTMVVCQAPRIEEGSMDLLLHFHGAVDVVAENYAKSKLKGALIIVNFKGLSAAYAKPFRKSPELFDALLAKAAAQVGPRDGKTRWGRISVSSFSAGYGAVREILKTPAHFARIDAILAADSMYAGLESGSNERRPLEAHMRNYLRFGKLASEGKKALLITHSSQETPYASTTETANYLLQSLGIARETASRHDAESLLLASKASKGKLTVLGYRGTTGQDHLQHLRQIHLWWRRL